MAHGGTSGKTDYLTNTSSGACSCALYSVASDNSLKRNGYYAACELFVTQTTDEDGHTGYTFTDKLGQMLLQRVMNGTVAHDTYYVYDDFGNLRYVLPPTTADALTAATTWPDTHAVLQNRVYIYKYDERNRCILKKLPGCDPVEMTYDRSDRLVFSRDGNQKAKGGNGHSSCTTSSGGKPLPERGNRQRCRKRKTKWSKPTTPAAPPLWADIR